MKGKQDIWAFHRVLRRLGRLSAGAAPAGELSKGAYFCLAAICNGKCEQSGHEGVHVWKLAERTHVHPPAVSRTLRELEGKGLIERSVDQVDRRNVKVSPTPAGLAFWAQVEAEMETFFCRVQDKMGADNMSRLVDLCDRLCGIMEEEQTEHVQSTQTEE